MTQTLDTQPEASHFIAGAPAEDRSGTPFQSLCPATGRILARLHEATPAIIDRAIASAADAQAGWAAMKPADRGAVLRRAAALLRERNHALSVLETRDTGKPLQETLVADAASGAEVLDYFGGIAAGITGEHTDLGGDFIYTRREPLGVCAGIGAWNYPIQIACWKAAPALACGNALVFKPSEMTPLTAFALAGIFIEAGAPAGLFNVVQGGGAVGAALARDPRIAKVSLTGSVETGRKLAAAAGEGLKPATMELGGKSPLIVFPDADLEEAISGAILGNFYSSGQICSNGTRVFVHKDVAARFIARLCERLKGVVMGDPLDPKTNFGPMISARQRDRAEAYVQGAIKEGAQLAAGGGRPDIPGWFLEPTVLAGVTDEMTVAREEVFGPVMSVLEFSSEEEVIARANATPFGLAAGVFTRDIARAHRCAARLEAGTCWINTYNLTPAEMPFGGIKASGMGRENSRAAIEHYTRLKSVYVGMSHVEAPY